MRGWPCLTHDRVDQGLLGRLDVVEKGMEDLGPLGDREVRPDALIERPSCLRQWPAGPPGRG